MKKCTCFALKRECDPDICVCTACSDPPSQLITSQRCQNDNILMRRERATLIARSDISGWGLFNKYPLKAGDFIGEYVGEAITQEEAERRGVLYDVKNQNYLFLAASDLVIDAMRKGNKMRFIVSRFFIAPKQRTLSHCSFVFQESFGRPKRKRPK